MMQDILFFREFRSNSDIIQLPFPERSLTVPEIACIVEVAETLGMSVQRRGAVSVVAVVVVVVVVMVVVMVVQSFQPLRSGRILIQWL